MGDIGAWETFYQKLASIGFPGVMFFALLGSYFDIWMWVKQHRLIIARFDADVVKVEATFCARLAEAKARELDLQHRNDQLLQLALRAGGLTDQFAQQIVSRS